MRLRCCIDIDLSWADWCCAIANCVRSDPADSFAGAEGVPGDNSVLVASSVRSAFDLYLRTVSWPSGSEIIFSGLTVPDMPKIAMHHGHVPIGVDVDARTAFCCSADVERRVTPKTKAIVVAHLFGARQTLSPLLSCVQRHGLALIEDCAQAYRGPEWLGSEEADISLFSFGPMKIATALGGAVVRVRDPDLLESMRQLHSGDRVQSTWSYLWRVLRYGVLKAVSAPHAYSIAVSIARSLGIDHEQLIHSLTANIPSADWIDTIRSRPCRALQHTIKRRLEQGSIVATRRTDPGKVLIDSISENVDVAPHGVEDNCYWVVPVLVEHVEAFKSEMRRRGFDVLSGRLVSVDDGLAGASRLANAAYIPFSPRMSRDELRREGELVSCVVQELQRRS